MVKRNHDTSHSGNVNCLNLKDNAYIIEKIGDKLFITFNVNLKTIINL